MKNVRFSSANSFAGERAMSVYSPPVRLAGIANSPPGDAMIGEKLCDELGTTAPLGS